MQRRFVDLNIAVEMMGHEWTDRKVIKKIKKGELPAYARIHICLQDDSADEVEEKYEIARITKLNKNSRSQELDRTEWFNIQYEPISNAVGSGELGGKYVDDLHQVNDKYFDPLKGENVERAFDFLKTRSVNTAIISPEEICLVTSDIERILSRNELPSDVKSQPEQEQVKQKTARYERPTQLERKGEIGTLKKLLNEAIQDYYIHNNKYPGTLDSLLTFIKDTYLDRYLKIKRSDDKFPEYVYKISRMNLNDDEKCLLITSKKKPYPKSYLQTKFRERKQIAINPSSEISPI